MAGSGHGIQGTGTFTTTPYSNQIIADATATAAMVAYADSRLSRSFSTGTPPLRFTTSWPMTTTRSIRAS